MVRTARSFSEPSPASLTVGAVRTQGAMADRQAWDTSLRQSVAGGQYDFPQGLFFEQGTVAHSATVGQRTCLVGSVAASVSST